MLNLGSLQFGLSINTQALRAAVNRIEEFGKAVEGVQAKANRGADTAIAQLRKQENAVISAASKLTAFTNQISNAKITPQMKTELITQANREFNNLSKTIAETGKIADATKFDRSVAQFSNAISNLKTQMASLPKDDGAGARSTKMIEEARATEKAAAAYMEFNKVLGIGANSGKSASASASVFKEQAAAVKATESALLRQSNAYERIAEKVRNVNATIERSNLDIERTTQLTERLDAIRNKAQGQLVGGGVLKPSQFAGISNETTRGIGDVNRLFRDMVAPADKASASFLKWKNTLHSLGDSALLLNGHLGGMSTRMFALNQLVGSLGLKMGLAAAGIAGLSIGMFALGSGTISTAIQLEKASKALTAVTGTSVEAATQLDFVRKVADQAGIVFTTAAQGFARYEAAARAAGQSTAETERQFKSVSLAAGTLNLSAEDTDGVFRALEQIMSKGAVQSEELRGQLGDRLPGAFAIAARAMGTTTAHLQKMMKAGEVLSNDFVPKFVDAMTKAYNIDPSKNIDTTQASINRLTNATTDFYAAFAQSTGVMTTFKNVVNGLAAVLASISAHMDDIVRVSVGVVGAVGGAVAAFLALQAILVAGAGITAFVGWVSTVAVLIKEVTTLTELWALAQAALNTAMLANPIGAVLALVARLALVVGGAVLGYNYLQKALLGTNSALADTTSIETFITAQLAMRTATDAATASLIKQQQVKLQQAVSEQKEALSQVDKVQKSRDLINNSQDIFGNKVPNPYLAHQADVSLQKETINLKQKTAAVEAQAHAVNGLAQVIKTPMGTPNQDLFGQVEKKTKQAHDNIDSILNLIDAYRAAQEKLAALKTVDNKDPQSLEKIDDMLKAKETIRKLSEKEKGMAEGALVAAGLSTGHLTQDVTALITATRIGEEQSQAFGRVWKNIDSDFINMQGIKKQVEYLTNGGDYRQVYLVKAASDAQDALRKLDSDHLAAIKSKLNAMGFAGESAQEALTAFFATGDQASHLVDALSSVAKAMEDVQQRASDTTILTRAYSQSAWVGDAATKMLANKKAAEDFGKALIAGGMSAEAAAAQVDAFYKASNQADELEHNLEIVKKHADAFKQLWEDTAHDATTSIMSIIDGTKSLGAAITDFFMGIVKRFTENALNNVFDGLLESLTHKPGQAGAAETTKAASTTANTAALASNTLALLQLSTIMSTMGAGGSGGGGGGLLGAITSGLGGLFGGGGGGLGDSMASFDPTLNFNVNDLFAPRALGGPMSKGSGYTVNEAGTNGEIFFPGSSGGMVPLDKLGGMGGGGSTHIDARTTIDARGATQDAIMELTRKMDERDTRLRAQLPYLIDGRVAESSWRLRGGYN